MTITHVAGLVVLNGSLHTKKTMGLVLAHFSAYRPPISLKRSGGLRIIIDGDLHNFGTEEIPKIETWFSNRLATLEEKVGVTVKLASLVAEVEDPHVFYIWVRGSEPIIKAVAMEA